ncbi:hypothetical protein Thu_189 [Bacillus phage Thurquoise]|uniref:Uncharacterized protein n=1 Tax=Bacillus phage Deep Blue TaxID=1792245 RepID=A0A140HLQ9_9CAUD|nr:DNA binding protein [Bacillus phage Deep Blue]AMO25921.1 hypothetical protein Blue_098 [Bacillus phage Deep Blue]UXQ89032.1 hypothetical protein Thu_189 [Bacillus phage Thurquoise]
MSKVEKLDITNDFREEDTLFQPTLHTISSSEEKIATDYQNGLGITDLTSKYDVSVGTVYNALRRQKVTLRKGMYKSRAGNRLLTMATLEKDSLVEDYLSGMAMTEIYKKHRINKHGCYTILDERSIARRGGSRMGAGKKVEKEDEQLSLLLDKLEKGEIKKLEAHIEGETLYVKATVNVPTPLTNINVYVNYKEEN